MRALRVADVAARAGAACAARRRPLVDASRRAAPQAASTANAQQPPPPEHQVVVLVAVAPQARAEALRAPFSTAFAWGPAATRGAHGRRSRYAYHPDAMPSHQGAAGQLRAAVGPQLLTRPNSAVPPAHPAAAKAAPAPPAPADASPRPAKQHRAASSAKLPPGSPASAAVVPREPLSPVDAPPPQLPRALPLPLPVAQARQRLPRAARVHAPCVSDWLVCGSQPQAAPTMPAALPQRVPARVLPPAPRGPAAPFRAPRRLG